MPKIYGDYGDGQIAARILDGLHGIKTSGLAALQSRKQLWMPSKLSWKSLVYEALDAYADTSGFSVRYFIFGSDEVPTPYYTPLDHELIRILNQMPEYYLKYLRKLAETLYHVPMINDVPSKPDARFFAILNSKDAGLITEIPEQDRHKYRKDIVAECNRYKKGGYQTNFRWNPDCWPDLAVMLGVSVRWIMGVKDHPLFCDSAVADDVFECYTLMKEQDRRSFLGVILSLSFVEAPALEEAFRTGGNILG